MSAANNRSNSRFAFITDEFVNRTLTGGGLATYLDRMSRTLVDMGVEVEVFVRCTDRSAPHQVDHHGVLVHNVSNEHPVYNRLSRIPIQFLKEPWGGIWSYLRTSATLGRAFKRRHREKPFHAVQSTNCSSSGLFVPRMKDCPHLVRLSSHREKWFQVDGKWHLRGARCLADLERRSICGADIVYAPSRYVADLCREGWRDDVKVLRPPVFLEDRLAGELPPGCPPRFLFHYGQLNARKGTVALARALPIVWKEAPDFSMVWAGILSDQEPLHEAIAAWGEHAGRVLMPGRLDKPQVYSLIDTAECTVLPSLVDNLPNSVIESLAMKKGVVGFRGGSVDELVEDGRNGVLVEYGDEQALAEVLLRVWRGELEWLRGPVPEPAIFEEMKPEFAAGRLLALAGISAPPESS